MSYPSLMIRPYSIVLILSVCILFFAPFWPVPRRLEPQGSSRYEYRTIRTGGNDLNGELARATQAGWEPLSITLEYSHYDGRLETRLNGRFEGSPDGRVEGHFDGPLYGHFYGLLDERFVILVRKPDHFPRVP